MTMAEVADVLELQTPLAAGSGRRFRVARGILRKKLAFLSVIVIAVFYLAGILAPWAAPYGENEQPARLTAAASNASPSADHLLGTDRLGRDVLTRVMFACRTTLIYTVIVLVMGGLFLGVGLGLLAGYRGGWVDTAIMRVGEVLGGVPTLILILAITAAFRTRLTDAGFWLGDHTFLNTQDARTVVQFALLVTASVPFAWIGGCRVVRAQTLRLRETQFVEAAESQGASTFRILSRHIFPSVLPLFLVGVTGGMAGIALTEVSLSFLGLGISEPASSFGTLIADGAGPRAIELFPHLFYAPTIPVVLFFLAWNLLGDALVDLLEVRSTRDV